MKILKYICLGVIFSPALGFPYLAFKAYTKVDIICQEAFDINVSLHSCDDIKIYPVHTKE